MKIRAAIKTLLVAAGLAGIGGLALSGYSSHLIDCISLVLLAPVVVAGGEFAAYYGNIPLMFLSYIGGGLTGSGAVLVFAQWTAVKVVAAAVLLVCSVTLIVWSVSAKLLESESAS
jgi:hypothetical protein